MTMDELTVSRTLSHVEVPTSDRVEEQTVNGRVSSDDRATIEPLILTGIVGHNTPRLSNQERTRRHIVRLQIGFPESGEDSRGDISEIETGAAPAANLSRGLKEICEELQSPALQLDSAVTEAGGEERIQELGFARDRAVSALTGP